MKKIIHKSDSRGYADHGWLKSYHSFSFANYYNPEKIRFGTLRVINDDIIAGGMGFGTHPHDNMEIVTIPLEGEIAHKDSTGNMEVIRKNEIQIMSAGSGLTHSEFNNSDTETASLLQIWVFPKEKNINPRYDQKIFDPSDRENKFSLVVSPGKENGALWINQNAYFSIGKFEKGLKEKYQVRLKGNGVYFFVIEGKVELDGGILDRRDAAGIEGESEIDFKAIENSEILVIEIPMN